MLRASFMCLAMVVAGSACLSCAPDKPVGPPNEENQMPWNPPIAGQGGGAFGMIPQLNERR